jgi:hypothetical protein
MKRVSGSTERQCDRALTEYVRESGITRVSERWCRAAVRASPGRAPLRRGERLGVAERAWPWAVKPLSASIHLHVLNNS